MVCSLLRIDRKQTTTCIGLLTYHRDHNNANDNTNNIKQIGGICTIYRKDQQVLGETS